MARDFIMTIFYGVILPESAAKKIKVEHESSAGEGDGIYMFSEKVEMGGKNIEIISIGTGMKDGYPESYRVGVAIEESVFRTYLNMSNELHTIHELTEYTKKKSWDDELKSFLKEHDIILSESRAIPQKPEWWIHTNG